MTWMRSIFRNAPIFVDRGSGASFTDLDGNAYLDFNVSDLSMTMGFGNEAIAAALAAQARRGAGVENVAMLERKAAEFQESEDLEAVAVVVGDAEQLGIGIEGDHWALPGTDGGA